MSNHSNERMRRVREVYHRFEAHRNGMSITGPSLPPPPPPPPMIPDDGYHMDLDHPVMSGRSRRYLMQRHPPPLPPPPHMEVQRNSQDMDQPADLSMNSRRESGSMSVGVDLSRGSSFLGSSSGRHHNHHSRSGGLWRGAEPSEEGVLDLASRPPRGTPDVNTEVKDENLSCSEVIVLSDEEAAAGAAANTTSSTPKLNGHSNGGVSDEDESPSNTPLAGPAAVLKEMTKEEVEQRRRQIMKLKENLRSEEMKLVLLKKLQLSHQLKDNIPVNSQPTPGNKVSSNNSNNHNMSGSSQNNNSSSGNRGVPGLTSDNVPPPLLRGQNNMVKSGGHHSTHHLIPPLGRPHNAHGPPPLLQNHRGSTSNMSYSSSNHHMQLMPHQPSNAMRNHSIMNRPPVTTPPNVVMGYQLPSTQTQVQIGHTVSVTPSPSPSVSQQQQQQSLSMEPQQRGDGQTQAQRQAAAKLALRKQLEKTLLQIPPPKPPPPELHFIPNPSNTEFIYLVGLESVVNFITEGDRPHEDEAPKPFNCIQCNTDFTPVWKWENTKKGTVICEQCVTSNIKKALKAEHTNRLKTAFVKALQQEQEIEARMAQVSSSPPSPPAPISVSSSSVPPPPPPPPAPVLQLPKMNEPLRQAHASAAAAVAASASATHQQLLRLPLHQPLPAHMLAPLSPFLAQAYQYQVMGKNSVASNELQRQYLLDMIPPRSLSQQGSINWKT